MKDGIRYNSRGEPINPLLPTLSQALDALFAEFDRNTSHPGGQSDAFWFALGRVRAIYEAAPMTPERSVPIGEEVAFIRDALQDRPDVLAVFESHIEHDREALGFALAANIGPIRVSAIEAESYMGGMADAAIVARLDSPAAEYGYRGVERRHILYRGGPRRRSEDQAK